MAIVVWEESKFYIFLTKPYKHYSIAEQKQ